MRRRSRATPRARSTFATRSARGQGRLDNQPRPRRIRPSHCLGPGLGTFAARPPVTHRRAGRPRRSGGGGSEYGRRLFFQARSRTPAHAVPPHGGPIQPLPAGGARLLGRIRRPADDRPRALARTPRQLWTREGAYGRPLAQGFNAKPVRAASPAYRPERTFKIKTGFAGRPLTGRRSGGNPSPEANRWLTVCPIYPI